MKNQANRLWRHSFLLLLACSLAVGFLGAKQLTWLADAKWTKWSVVFATLFAMAWPLSFGSLRTALMKPTAPLLATVVNFLVVPLLAWPFSKLLNVELGIGLLVACSVPSTLATGSVWTRRAGGDDRISMLVTIITNSLCFFVTPWLVFSLTGSQISASLFFDTVWKLLVFVVLPIFLAQLFRLEPRSAAWASAHKPLLGRFAQAGVLIMTTAGAVQAGLRMESAGPLAATNVNQLLLLGVVVIAVHLLALALASQSARIMGLGPDAQIAVAISGSQKTLMVGLSVAMNLGVSILPMVAYHALQLLVDTVIADRHRRKHPPNE